MEKKEQILRMIEKNKKRILEINSTIWDYAEPGMKEFRSADYYTRVFREEGFEVETGVSGIPTAFIASWGGGLPVIGFLGEFDALPGLSQESGCTGSFPPAPMGKAAATIPWGREPRGRRWPFGII